MSDLHRIRIYDDGSGYSRGHTVEIDGRQVTLISRLRLDLDAGSLPVLLLELAGPVGSDIDTTAIVTIDDELAATLIQLGWTPPAGSSA